MGELLLALLRSPTSPRLSILARLLLVKAANSIANATVFAIAAAAAECREMRAEPCVEMDSSFPVEIQSLQALTSTLRLKPFGSNHFGLTHWDYLRLKLKPLS